jgi:flagellar export protein FliJ
MFRFRLQRVLDLRARSERDAATALVSAQDVETAARAAEARLQASRAELAERMTLGMAGGAAAPAGSARVGELRNMNVLLEHLDRHVSSASAQSAEAARSVQAREDALRAAYRERRTLDRLKERHQEQWQSDAAAADRTLMDEIALTRFTRPAAGAPSPTD